MKTISLTDEAYSRLASWKTGQDDSFSKVIDRLVPKRGTLGAVLDAAGELPELSAHVLNRLEREARRSSAWKDQGDPWNT